MKKTNNSKPAISTRLPAVTVEYDGAKGKRPSKHFEDAHEAKAFYVAKDKAGKHPKVTSGELATAEPATATATATTPATTAKPEPTTATPQPAATKAAKWSRPETAGRVLAAHGLDAKLDALVAEVDELYGQPNPRETIFCLRNARNAIAGYLAATGK